MSDTNKRIRHSKRVYCHSVTKKKKLLKAFNAIYIKVTKLTIISLIIVWAVFFVNKFILVRAHVPSESMEPTIVTGDTIIVNKFAYVFSKPKRGDIIMFKFPDDESHEYLKRIIGLPGDIILIRQGHVYINNSPVPILEPYVKEEPIGDYGPYNVPAEHYFVLGDNRNVSLDSRSWKNKYIAKEKIDGKVLIDYFSKINILKKTIY